MLKEENLRKGTDCAHLASRRTDDCATAGTTTVRRPQDPTKKARAYMEGMLEVSGGQRKYLGLK